MNDILPPKRPLNRQQVPPTAPQATSPAPTVDPVPTTDQPKPPIKKRHVWRWLIIGIISLVVLAGAGAVAWYQYSLQPVNSAETSHKRVTIAEGTSPSDIGALLERSGLIRSKYAFDIYTKLSDTRSKLQAGAYSLSPSQTLAAIVKDIVEGKVDMFTVTFLPGATVAENKDVLKKAGYSQQDIDAAFAKQYDHPLFADKPQAADLEGYIYGETYSFGSDVAVEEILETTFDEYFEAITQDGMIAKFEKHGLNLFQAITLASIVQREVSGEDDERQVAQVFYSRLAIDMPLGSDVTYHYAAKKMGVEPSTTLDSPYNTRIHKGLPPGPIAAPGLSALKAVANPAAGDYLYFLSGDDDKTYFAKTDEQHQANIEQHCKIKCLLP